MNKSFQKKKIQIVRTKSDDIRSYHINSDKIKEQLNFEPKLTVENAVQDLCTAFKKNLIKNSFKNDIYFNVQRLKNNQIKWKKELQ